MRFLCNDSDPKDPNARNLVFTRVDQTQDEAYQQHLRWLADKIIGEPHATEFYTVQQLKDMGLVGIYAVGEIK